MFFEQYVKVCEIQVSSTVYILNQRILCILNSYLIMDLKVLRSIKMVKLW